MHVCRTKSNVKVDRERFGKYCFDLRTVLINLVPELGVKGPDQTLLNVLMSSVDSGSAPSPVRIPGTGGGSQVAALPHLECQRVS